MAAVIQLMPLDDRGREILDELEEKTGEKPTETDDDGARRYYLRAQDVGVDGFDAMLASIDSNWRDHVTRA